METRQVKVWPGDSVRYGAKQFVAHNVDELAELVQHPDGEWYPMAHVDVVSQVSWTQMWCYINRRDNAKL